MENEETWIKFLQFAGSTLTSMTFKAMFDLEIFNIISSFGSEAKISAAKIASRLPQQHPNTCTVLEQMLRVMASNSFLNASIESGETVYGLAPASKYLTKDATRETLANIHQLYNSHLIFTSTYMKDDVIEGGDQFKKRNGSSFYEIVSKDDEFRALFVNGMGSYSSLVMPNILFHYKGFEGLSSIVDVGGGNGKIIADVVSMYPSIKGINYDLPHVIEIAPNLPGVEHVAGDMFQSIPKADALILKDVLHNWKDEECLDLLKNCWDAIPDGGKVIVIQLLKGEIPDSSYASQVVENFDLLMILLVSGKERTQNQISELSKKVGFNKCQLASISYGFYTVLELIK